MTYLAVAAVRRFSGITLFGNTAWAATLVGKVSCLETPSF